jgi:hypothetical protein
MSLASQACLNSLTRPACWAAGAAGGCAARTRRRAEEASWRQAAGRIWIVGAQKVVPDLSTALRRVEEHALPLESARAQAAYGQPSAVNHLLILNAEPYPGRSTVLLLREAIGF